MNNKVNPSDSSSQYGQPSGFDTQYGPPPQATPGTEAYPPQPPTYMQSVMVVSQPGVMPAVNGSMYRYGEIPALVVCQFCSATITTQTTFITGTQTYAICLILWLVGLGLGCCLIPFCMNSCKDVVHTCPNCKATVGRYSRM